MFIKSLLLLLSGGRYSSAFHLATSGYRHPSSSLSSYLESLQSSPANGMNNFVPSAEPLQEVVNNNNNNIYHAPLEYFSFDNLESKGPRATCDWGTPQDWSRKLAEDGIFRSGAWYCTPGGWPSPNGKAVTEVFYMLEGHGCLSDADGMRHYFGPGDMVTIPKGHTGRWDVNSPILKVWAVNAHSNVEERSSPIRVKVDHYNTFVSSQSSSSLDPLYRSTVDIGSSSNILYDVGSTKVGYWSCSNTGSFPVSYGTRQWFHVLKGVLFVTTSGGTSRRCIAGDTVMLPAGWSGFIDVVEPTEKVFCAAAA